MLDFNKSPFNMTYNDKANVIKYNALDTVSYVKTDIREMDDMSFDDGKTIIDESATDFNEILVLSSDDANEYFNNKIDGVRYYNNGKYLLIPNAIDKYFEAHLQQKHSATISFYNLDDDNIWGYQISKPEKLPFDKKEPKISVIERKYYSYIDEELYILYDNLPKKLYTNIIIDNQFVMFDVDTNEFYTKHSNQNQLIEKYNKIAENGIEAPLELYIEKDGKLLPNNCEDELFIAFALGLPTIPVAIISSLSEKEPYYVKNEPKIDKIAMQEFLNPYMILADEKEI